MSNVVMVFLGGLIMAVVVENSNLHRRIALNLIKIIGTSPNRVMLSFMGATGFLSMWISNTATTAIMIPIAQGTIRWFIQILIDSYIPWFPFSAIIDSLAKNTKGNIAKSFSGSSGAIILLSVAYAANIGGTAFVTGTPPNLVYLTLQLLSCHGWALHVSHPILNLTSLPSHNIIPYSSPCIGEYNLVLALSSECCRYFQLDGQ